MYDLKKQTFVVLTLAAVNEFQDNVKKISVGLQQSAIVEAAAVKIKEGEIEGHYRSFAAIDGYDARNIELGELNGSYSPQAEHLIGAPPFKEVAERLHDYIGGAVLIVHNRAYPFAAFLQQARNCGYVFNNEVIGMEHVYDAARLQCEVEESGVRVEHANVLQIAHMLACDKTSWTEIFLDYGIFFDPGNRDPFMRNRDDPLSWALVFARLFLKLARCDPDDRFAIDNENPFC